MDEISQLTQRVEQLEGIITAMQSSFSFPLRVEQAMTGRGFIKVPRTLGTGIVKSNGDGTFSVLAPGVAGSYYVASISTGPTTTFIQFDSNGIKTV